MYFAFRARALTLLLSGFVSSSLVAAAPHQHYFGTTHESSQYEADVAVPAPVSLTPFTGVINLFQNDLDWRTVPPSHLLLDTPATYNQSRSRCHRLGEGLARNKTLVATKAELDKQLRYLAYNDPDRFGTSSTRRFWIANKRVLTRATSGAISIDHTTDLTQKYSALCTQQAPRSIYAQQADPKFLVTTVHGNLTWRGTRDSHSFRFLSLPYAQQPQRFAYSTALPSDPIVTYNATYTDTNRKCVQYGSGVEDCLYASIYTPYIPSDVDRLAKRNLKPILVWIHGGGGNSGSGVADPTFDGGQFSSRNDVVVVAINYRLGSLGFLSASDSITGNYAISDIISALQFVRKYGSSFGGDLDQVTIAGQSTGAQLVSAILGSPEATGLFAGAIVQSGRPADQKNAYRNQTVARSDAKAVVEAVGCKSNASAATLLACLRKAKAYDLPTYNRLVVDGKYLTSPSLGVTSSRRVAGATVNRVPVIMGWMRDEMGSLGTVPDISIKNLTAALEAAGVAETAIKVVTNKTNAKIFPVPTAANGIQNLSVTIETHLNNVARCGQESTVALATNSSAFTKLFAYTFDTRSWQLDWYPGNHCMNSTVIDPTAYHCHSGDLLAVFANPGYAFGTAGPRDSSDLRWLRAISDQWGAFVRQGDPRPAAAYMTARGYGATEIQAGGKAAWAPMSQSKDMKMLSLSPDQAMIPLRRYGEQCDALSRDLQYINRGE